MKFSSFLSAELSQYADYRIASGLTGQVSLDNLRYFDRYLSERYPDSEVLTQDMIAGWFECRKTESTNSCLTRTNVVCAFLNYARLKGWTDITPPLRPAAVRSNFRPHGFTEQELKSFFDACDNIKMDKPRSLRQRIRKVSVPVFFRLLYSTGMRTCEARTSLRADVDWKTGIIEIRDSKGVDQHRIVLHQTMLALLDRYDKAMEKIIPGHKYLFPGPGDTPHSRMWQAYNFNAMWKQCCRDKARAYDLRSLYATTNINSWQCSGMEWYGNLVYLSRSMGHRFLQSTAYYYHLTPYLSDKMTELTAEGFDSMLPKTDGYYEE